MLNPQQSRSPGRTGRPPLTERRKAETRLEVARAAVRLFLAKGVAETSAEDIAAEAGISSRTLWRYFPTKDSCVMPLLTGGIEHTARHLRSWRSDQGVAELLAMMQSDYRESADVRTAMLNLVRLTKTEAGLRAVWLEAHREAEPVFAEALAQRAGLPEPDLTVTVQAAMINAALRAAVEYYASTSGAPDSMESVVTEALHIAAQGFPTVHKGQRKER
ncbi:TetR/AcrR family transcriptional regulator [Kibdelosporangium aridum]|uniref:TetR/AcrR family transcriptional regulator n=1 Tax=Kibdelosporangium aridum TaxID=2030 RepID=UPI00068C2EC6